MHLLEVDLPVDVSVLVCKIIESSQVSCYGLSRCAVYSRHINATGIGSVLQIKDHPRINVLITASISVLSRTIEDIGRCCHVRCSKIHLGSDRLDDIICNGVVFSAVNKDTVSLHDIKVPLRGFTVVLKELSRILLAENSLACLIARVVGLHYLNKNRDSLSSKSVVIVCATLLVLLNIKAHVHAHKLRKHSIACCLTLEVTAKHFVKLFNFRHINAKLTKISDFFDQSCRRSYVWIITLEGELLSVSLGDLLDHFGRLPVNVLHSLQNPAVHRVGLFHSRHLALKGLELKPHPIGNQFTNNTRINRCLESVIHVLNVPKWPSKCRRTTSSVAVNSFYVNGLVVLSSEVVVVVFRDLLVPVDEVPLVLKCFSGLVCADIFWLLSKSVSLVDGLSHLDHKAVRSRSQSSGRQASRRSFCL